MAPWRDRRGVRARRLVVPRRDDLGDRRLQPLAARHLSGVAHRAAAGGSPTDWTAAIWLVGLGRGRRHGRDRHVRTPRSGGRMNPPVPRVPQGVGHSALVPRDPGCEPRRMSDQRAKTVLLVNLDATERDGLGEALEDAGFQVLDCPGPSFPDYTCIGAREGYCPLVEHADSV